MPAFPRHYQQTVAWVLRYSMIMLVIALLTGVMYAESAKKVPLGLYSVETSFQANYTLSLIHGHTMMLGVFLPLTALALILIPFIVLNSRPLSAGLLKWVFGLYVPCSLWSLGLLFYKAYFIQLMVRNGSHDFAAIDHALFASNHVLRTVIYAIPHSGFGVAFIILIAALWKSMSVPKNTSVTQS